MDTTINFDNTISHEPPKSQLTAVKEEERDNCDTIINPSTDSTKLEHELFEDQRGGDLSDKGASDGIYHDGNASMSTASAYMQTEVFRTELLRLNNEIAKLRIERENQKREMKDLVEENIQFQEKLHTKDEEIEQIRTSNSDAEVIFQTKLDRYEQEFDQKNEEIADLRKKISDQEYVILQKDCVICDADSRMSLAVKALEEERDQLTHRIQKMVDEENEHMMEHNMVLQKYEGILRFCTDETKLYAQKCLQVMTLVSDSLDCLDEEISQFYNDDDDANYFYVRRRMKFIEATEGLKSLKKYWVDLYMIANYGMIFENSTVNSVLERDPVKELESFKYFIYTMLMRDTIGPTLILLREMIGMPRYVGVNDIRNMNDIISIHEKLMLLTTELGYRIADVELFAPMPPSNEIDCVDVAEIDIEGLTSGCIYEITKLAVQYGTYSTMTEVKIKQ